MKNLHSSTMPHFTPNPKQLQYRISLLLNNPGKTKCVFVSLDSSEAFSSQGWGWGVGSYSLGHQHTGKKMQRRHVKEAKPFSTLVWTYAYHARNKHQQSDYSHTLALHQTAARNGQQRCSADGRSCRRLVISPLVESPRRSKTSPRREHCRCGRSEPLR